MSSFKGKNSIKSTIALAVNRSRYDVRAFPNNPPEVVDFNFAERVMFGRVNSDLDVVVPISGFLSTIISIDNNKPAILMNFVADAFSDMQKSFERATNSSKIDANDRYLSSLNVKRAYINPLELYEQYIDSMMTPFHDTFMNKARVLNFKAYVDEFSLFAKQMSPDFPITYTGWHRSRNSNMFTSGLVLDLSGLAIDNDELKENFINSRNFSFYRNVCINNGFSIVKNSPWVIAADLNSPAMLRYMETYGLTSERGVFDNQFLRTTFRDIPLLRSVLISYYNILAENFTYEKNIDVCGKGVKVRNMPRNPVDLEEANRLVPDSYMLQVYNDIRFYEEGMRFSLADKNRFSRNAKNLEKVFDMERAVGYINEQYRSIYKSKEGGINYLLKRKREKDK